MDTIIATTYPNTKAGAEQFALDAMVMDYGSDASVPVAVCHAGAIGEFIVRFRCGVEWVVNPRGKSFRSA